MDALDILGGLLGGSGSMPGRTDSDSRSRGMGGRILEELVKSGRGRSTAQPPAPSQSVPRSRSSSPRSLDVQSEIGRLEELLGVAAGRQGNSSADSQRRMPMPQAEPRNPSRPPKTRGTQVPVPSESSSEQTSEDKAILLIQAMIHAAKADGKLDSREQETILSRVPNDPETINYLRQEFARPTDVRQFAWNVPMGMEIQVYTISLATIEVNSPAEVQYLKDLAHGLRLSSEFCNEIHARYGAPPLY